MTSQSHNTAERPSDAYPACPDCKSDVFVDATDYGQDRYYCHACDAGFRAPNAFRPPDHVRGDT